MNEGLIRVKYRAYPELGPTTIKASGFNPNVHERLDPPKRRGRPRGKSKET